MAEKDNTPDLPNKDTENDKAEKVDEELSELLDSALEDFKRNDKDDNSEIKTKDNTKPTPPSSLWEEEFLKQCDAFEQNIQSFSSGDTPLTAEQLSENMQRLVEAATQAVGGEPFSPDTEFSSIITEALKNLSGNAENIQSQFSEEDFMNMMSSLEDPSLDGTEPPFFRSIMQSFFSKDVLYPPLSGVVEKYPQWLQDNVDKLSPQEHKQYSEQLRVLKEICSELEKESESDSQEVKTERFDKLLRLMKQVQDCGFVPMEIIEELNPDIKIFENMTGHLVPPGLNQSQCSLM